MSHATAPGPRPGTLSYALTPLQQGMLAHHLRAPNSGVDIEQLVCSLPEAVDANAMRRAWQVVVDRHDVLRTAIEWSGLDQPRQTVFDGVELPFRILDWRDVEVDERDARFAALLASDRAEGFELERAPLLRLTLISLGDVEHRLVWTFHHAILDGRCFPMVLREVFDAYDALQRGEGVPAAEPRRAFRDFVEWLDARDHAASDEFWRATLAGISNATPIPVARAVPTREPVVQGDVEQELEPAVTSALRTLAESTDVTLNTVIQAAWGLVIARYSGESDVVFGVARAGRRGSVPGAESMLGLFINTLPLRVRVRDEQLVTEWLRDVRSAWNALREHEQTPLARVHACSAVPAGQPLFDSMVMFESYELEASLQSLGSAWTRRGFRLHEQNGFPLTLAAYAGERLLLRLELDRTRFEDDVAERMLGHLATVLRDLASTRGERSVGSLSILPEREREQLLEGFAGERVRYEGGETLVARLSAQVARTPEAIAVTDERAAVTYAALDARATALAQRLRELGVGAGVLVGVCAERSVELVVALVAVVKAGGAYVPIDPEYPRERVAYMLADSGVGVVLTQARLVAALPVLAASGAELLVLEGGVDAPADLQIPRLAALARDDSAAALPLPLPLPAPDDPAYMIYTSGSTGQPKGAVNAHRGIVNRLAWMQAEYQLTPTDVVLQKTPFSFDVSVWEFFWPLLTGARLVMARPGGHRDTAYLADVMQQHGVTVCHFVPSMLRAFLADPAASQATSLRAVMASGEALPPDVVAQCYGVLPAARLHNLYGPTECAVDVSYWACPPSTTPPAVVPIGRAVANTRLYVLDARQQPVPIGVPGELYLAGVQVGLGYHNRPALTAERFVADPYAPAAERAAGAAPARMYRTGDRARWRADGTVEYLGRLDFQVKLRGFRIELGEIESALLTHEHVRDCVVVARAADGGEQRLVAYIVCDDARPTTSELRSFLLTTLPDYMVPSAFVVLDALPLSSNGKVDRRALPDPRVESTSRERAYEAPRNAVERSLADIWAKVLRVERVGVTDDFYELGGDSLLSIQIVSQAARAGLRISLTQVLSNPTVAGQALAAERIATTRVDPDAAPAHGDVPLTPVQRWFAELDTPDAQHWNQAFLFTVPASLDHERLRAALIAVRAHHDAMRLRFRRDGSGWHQSYASDAAGSIALARVELGAATDEILTDAIASTCEHAQASLDLEHGPIGRVVHFDLGSDRDGRLLIALHHLVVDGVSWRLLREDLESAYDQLERGATIALPPRTSSFAAWSAQLSTLARSKAMLDEVTYWAAETAPGTLTLPCDAADGANVEGEVHVAEVSLSADETRDLLQRVPAAYGTQINDVLLAAVGGALAAWMGSGHVLVDLEGHGREEVGGGLDVSRTIGWFTSVFPLRMELARAASPRERLIAAKERLRGVPGRGLGYGVLRYLREEPSLVSGAQPEVMFNYLGQFDQVVAGSRLFRFAAEPSGAWRSARATRRHKLEIIALVQDGRLRMRFGYARTVHNGATIVRLAESFAAALRGCIAHCLSPDAGGYTRSDFPLAGLDQHSLDRLLAGVRDVQDVYPLTPIQRMFLDAAGGATDPGLQQYRFELDGAIDPSVMRDAWRNVVRRHDVLRTRFVAESGAPLQLVMRRAELVWREEDWRGETDVAGRLDAFLREDRALGIDPSRAPLMRVALVRTGETRWTLVWTQHHLLLDRWSWPIVLREVGAYYDAALRGEQATLSPAAPFRDYVAWLATRRTDDAERFWREEIGGMSEPLRLLGARDGSTGEPGWDETTIALTQAETATLRQVARARGLALNVVIEGAWAIALSHVGARDDVTFGLAVDGRGADAARATEIVGVLINNVPVRARLDPQAQLGDWLSGLQRRQADLRAAEHASPEAIQQWSGLEWRHRLFESLVVFQDASAERGMAEWLGSGAKVTGAVTPTETAYPLTVLVGGDDRLFLRVISDRRQVPPALGEQLAIGTEAALRGLVSGLDLTIGALRGALPAVRSWTMDESVGVARDRVAPRNAVESVLARMWGDLLGVNDLGVTDNFLARGGHSLLATQIVSRVRETFQVEVPVRVLFQGPTVAELAVAVTGLERKPGQVARIAELIQRVDGMSADELRQSAAARDARARQTAMANGN